MAKTSIKLFEQATARKEKTGYYTLSESDTAADCKTDYSNNKNEEPLNEVCPSKETKEELVNVEEVETSEEQKDDSENDIPADIYEELVREYWWEDKDPMNQVDDEEETDDNIADKVDIELDKQRDTKFESVDWPEPQAEDYGTSDPDYDFNLDLIDDEKLVKVGYPGLGEFQKYPTEENEDK